MATATAVITPEGDARAALRAIVNRPFLETPKWRQQQWTANREGADEAILAFEKRMIKEMAALGVPMFAHNMVRTPQEQRAVYVQGHSNHDGTKPYAHRKHAVDIVHSVFAWGMTRDQWAVIGHVGKECGRRLGIELVWGGDWKRPYDPAHWEIAGWRDL